MISENVILGENCVYTTDCSQTGLNNNVLVCGPSGCGKTMSICEARLLETVNTSLVATVTKRRIVAKYKPLFEKRGYDVQDLDFANPQCGNIGYDPLDYVRNYQDITFLAESIVKSNSCKEYSKADPYWDEAATSLLSAEIAYILMTKEDASFADVLDMHDKLDFEEGAKQLRSSYDKQFEILAEKDPACFAVSCWKSFHQLPMRTASCVFGVLNTTIDTIFNPELRRMMAMRHKVDFEKLASRKTILFVTTRPANPTLNCFVNVFYGHVFKQLFEFAENQPGGVLPLPVHVLCDDFAAGSKIINFAEYISVFREKGISVTLMLQSESQLESMYGLNQATTIINNCDSYVYLGGMDLKTAQNISIRLNTPIDEILYMPLGQEVLFRRGQRPITTKRYDISKNKLYQEITEQYERTIASPKRYEKYMNNIFFVPEYSQEAAKLKTEDRIEKLIRDAEKDKSVLEALSEHDLDNVLNHLASSVKEKERVLDTKKEELKAAERRMRKICSFPVVRSRLIERKILVK